MDATQKYDEASGKRTNPSKSAAWSTRRGKKLYLEEPGREHGAEKENEGEENGGEDAEEGSDEGQTKELNYGGVPLTKVATDKLLGVEHKFLGNRRDVRR